MSVKVKLDNLHSYCCVCLKLVIPEEEYKPITMEQVPSDRSLGPAAYDLLVETVLDSSVLNEQHEGRGVICEKCYLTMQELQQFRSQCSEVYKFYQALIDAKDCLDERPILKVFEDETASTLRSHLFRLDVISLEDIPTGQILNGLDLFKAEYIELKAETLDQFEEKTTESLPPDDCRSSVSEPPEDAIKQESGTESSDSCEDDEPLAEIKRKRLNRKAEASKTHHTVCPASDCQELLAGQTYASHLKEFHRYGCKECGLILGSKYVMMKHTTIHSKLPSTVKCTFCERMFVNLAKMRAHTRAVHLELAPSYECDECSAVFDTHKLLKIHYHTHQSTDCDLCKTKYDHPDKLFSHMKKFHPKHLFSCEYCTRKFLTRAKFDRHLAKHSENMLQDEGYELLTLKTISIAVCKECEKQFSSEAHLSTHMISHDPASRPKIVIRKRSKEELNKLEKKYHCDQCGASYHLPSSLDKHIKTHSAAPFVCDICGSFFKSKSYLKTHVAYKHTKDFRYFCDLCSKACATSSDLVRHKRVHSEDRPYRCDQCEGRFKTMDGYRKHMRAHSGEKRFGCDLCEKRFMSLISMNTHRMSHTNEKPLKCFYCEQHFNVHKNRRIHILRKHPGLPTMLPAKE